jgi:hypothetical protein
MDIAIISDIHDNLANLALALNWCQQHKITKLLCCGDITNADTLKFIYRQFSGQIWAVSGNGDTFFEANLNKYPRFQYLGRTGTLTLGRLHLGLCHEPTKINQLLTNSSLSKHQLNFIFYGHTHKPWLEKQKQVYLVNPGNIANIYYNATFATLNTQQKKLELHLLTKL